VALTRNQNDSLLILPNSRINPAQLAWRPNVLTLSCKNRLTCRAEEAARLLPQQTRSGGSELQRTCRARAVRAARGGAPPGQLTGGFCQLVRAVGPPFLTRIKLRFIVALP
jgi:hypothetical protein